MSLAWTFLTDRLILRPFSPEDYTNWLTQHQNRLPSQYKHDKAVGDMTFCTREWFCDMVDSQQLMMRKDQNYIFGVFLKERGEQIGTIDLSTLLRYDFQWARIGYTIHNQFWNMGYAAESVQQALKIAFNQLNFHRVEAHISIDNLPSIKTAEKAGMVYEGLRQSFVYEFGEWADNVVYYKLADDKE